MLVALSVTGAADFQGILDHMRSEQAVPGTAAVIVRDASAQFLGASGLADLASGRPVTADTPFYTGSVSKVLTTLLVLDLVGDGVIALDDPAPSIPAGVVRIRDLLAHTSGLAREGDFGYWYSGRFPSSEALLAYLADAGLRFPPGTEGHYSNVGYAALGLEIERALGKPYPAVLAGRLLAPLGMTATGAPGPVDGIANGYTPPGRLLPDAGRPFAGVGAAVGDRHVRLYHDAAAMAPAFGIYSTARDMGRLLAFLLADENGAALLRTMRGRQVSGRGLGLRLGRVDGRPIARHDGWFAAHRAHLLIDAEAGLGVVVLTNSDSAKPRAIAEALYREALRLQD